MTQEEKQLLIQDLCARLPYGVICKSESYKNILFNSSDIPLIESEEIKPYLRPMSSMTEEERKIYAKLLFADLGGVYEDYYKALDYLHSIHVDYRGLIEMGLAIKVTEENNPYKLYI